MSFEGISTKEKKSFIIEEYEKLLKKGDIDQINKAQKKQELSKPTDFEKKELVQSAKAGIDHLLSQGMHPYVLLQIIDQFDTSEGTLEKYFHSPKIGEILIEKIKMFNNKFLLRDLLVCFPKLETLIMNDEKVKSLLEDYIIYSNIYNQINSAEKELPLIHNYFETENVREAVLENLYKFLPRTLLVSSNAIIDNINDFKLPEEYIRKFSKKAVLSIFTEDSYIFDIQNNLESVFTFMEKIPYAPEYLQSPEVIEIARERFIKKACMGDIDFALNSATLCNFEDKLLLECKYQSIVSCVKNKNIRELTLMINGFLMNDKSDFPESVMVPLSEFYRSLLEGRDISGTMKVCNITSQLDKYIEKKEMEMLIDTQIKAFLFDILHEKENNSNIEDIYQYIKKYNVSRETVDMFTSSVLAYLIKNEEDQDLILIESKKFIDGIGYKFDAYEFFQREKKRLFLSFKILLQQYTQKETEPMVKKTVDIFGSASDIESYNIVHSIYRDGTISKDAREFGVKIGRGVGLNQLEQGNKRFKQKIMEEDFDPQIIIDNKIAEKLFTSATRVESAQFSGRDTSIQERAKVFIKAKTENKIKEKDSFFEKSEDLLINGIDLDKVRDYKYSADFFQKYRSYQMVLSEVLDTMQDTSSSFKLESNFNNIVKKLTMNAAERLDSLPEEVKVIQSRNLEELKESPLFEIENIEEILRFCRILKSKELDDLVLKKLCKSTFEKFPDLLKNYKNMAKEKEISLSNITSMIDFFDHIVKSELLKDSNLSKNAFITLKNIIQTSILSQEASRSVSQAVFGKKIIKFVPTRGFIGEFSGEIGDACWANKLDEGLLVKHQNITPIIMISNPGTKDERPCGASVIIDAISNDGESLLIIRGLNPLENTINQLQVSDFFESFTAYIKKIGEKSGKKVAIVIDNHCGGSSTNRPILYAYLDTLKNSLTKIEIPDDENTIFNGYSISEDTYLL